MKVRTQVQLDPDDHRRLQEWARARGVSVSGAVRWLIRQHLGPTPGPDRVAAFLKAAGSVHSSRDDEGPVSAEHDRHIYARAGRP